MSDTDLKILRILRDVRDEMMGNCMELDRVIRDLERRLASAYPAVPPVGGE